MEVLTQLRIKLLDIEILTNFAGKASTQEVLTIFQDKTPTLTKKINLELIQKCLRIKRAAL